MHRFEWLATQDAGSAAWWRVDRDEVGRQLGVRVRAIDEHDCTPEVPRGLRDPRLCAACDLDVPHTGAFHRQFVPFRPAPWTTLLGRPQEDPLIAA